MNDSDQDLLARCLASDQRAWQELVRRHTRRVYNVAYRFTGRAEEAEDLTQEVFVKVYRNLNLGRYRKEQGAFTTWIAAVARNHAIDHYRRCRQERRVDGPQLLDTLPAPGGGPFRAVEKSETARFVHSGLRALPGDLRVILVLCDLEGLSYEEAARELAIPLGTVKSRLNRGRLELARRLIARRRASRPGSEPTR